MRLTLDFVDVYLHSEKAFIFRGIDVPDVHDPLLGGL